MVDIKTIMAGDRIQQNYGNHRTGTVIGVFHPKTGPMGISYRLDGEDPDDSWDWPESLTLVESKPEQPKEQLMEISMDKQYRTRDGREVRILCVDRNHEAYPVVALVDNSIISFTAKGRELAYIESDDKIDLIEYNPAQDLKLDQPIWVRNWSTSCWVPRHFASVDGWGKVMCWDDGCTSFTATEEYSKSAWDYWTATKPE